MCTRYTCLAARAFVLTRFMALNVLLEHLHRPTRGKLRCTPSTAYLERITSTDLGCSCEWLRSNLVCAANSLLRAGMLLAGRKKAEQAADRGMSFTFDCLATRKRRGGVCCVRCVIIAKLHGERSVPFSTSSHRSQAEITASQINLCELMHCRAAQTQPKEQDL